MDTNNTDSMLQLGEGMPKIEVMTGRIRIGPFWPGGPIGTFTSDEYLAAFVGEPKPEPDAMRLLGLREDAPIANGWLRIIRAGLVHVGPYKRDGDPFLIPMDMYASIAQGLQTKRLLLNNLACT